ncbi:MULTISPECIES: phosphotransferase family protein [unclassified Brevibacterium]|uniref:phosphotransferase family protein n=1 Tax=unclassified Brevibacterium TaxID=2614124 RepID=UPI003633550A
MTAQLVDVVETSAQAAELDAPPLLVLDAVTDHLDARGIGTGPVRWERIGEGQSNVTFRIRRDDVDIVLRRGPRPPIPRSTHDMVREARIQTVLGGQGIAVPMIVDVCEDESVLGVPFYLMDFVPGTVVTDTLPAVLESPDRRRRFGEALVDQLAALHDVDVTVPAVAALGRPEGYLERQVALFSSLWEKNTRRSLPAVGRLGAWLEANRPDTQRHSVVHGDYRAGNAMIAAQPPVAVAAILDWEMSTLGDPLADLGYFLATYSDGRHPRTVMDLTPVTGQPGFPSRADLTARYRDRAGLDLTSLPWYQALALWKAAIFSEAIYTRWLAGEAPAAGDFTGTLEHGVPALLDAASEVAATLR